MKVYAVLWLEQDNSDIDRLRCWGMYSTPKLAAEALSDLASDQGIIVSPHEDEMPSKEQDIRSLIKGRVVPTYMCKRLFDIETDFGFQAQVAVKVLDAEGAS